MTMADGAMAAWRATLRISLAGLLLTGCARDLAWAPADGAGNTRDDASGVFVTARPDVWPTDVPVAPRVVPMRVTIANDGERPLLILFSRFALIGAAGEAYPPLPPFRMEGGIRRPTVAPGYDPIGRDAAIAGTSGFNVAPFYAPLYPGLPMAGEPIFYDPDYYRILYHRWDTPPTDPMLRLALPEGVLQPGGTVSGFLYFEAPSEEGRYRLHMTLTDVWQDGELGIVSIPFVADR